MSLNKKTNLHSWLSQIAHANVQFPAARSLLPTLKTRMVVMAVTMITIFRTITILMTMIATIDITIMMLTMTETKILIIITRMKSLYMHNTYIIISRIPELIREFR